MTSTEVSCRHARQKTEVWSVAWTYAFCNRPIACRTGQVAKGNVRIRQRCPRAQGYVQMSRCAALCVRSGLAAILSGKRPRAHLYIESVLAIDPSIHRFIDGFPCRFFFAPPMPARSVERPQRGISALSLALPGNVNRGYFRSDGLPMQPEKKLAV
ncbi:Hypothetical Protein XCAW_02114 [Xanthomonas citri subsp. citri Aw12879]|nr:Hypothetical Protein XCAW_02114 [Xanthomonas citri subsp. citri Aw12879]